MPPNQTERFENLGGLGAGLAHDLCTLLMVIDGCASFALEALPPDHPAVAELQELRDAGLRANSLARQLVDLGRADSSIVVVADLFVIVHGLEPLIRRLLGDGIALSINSSLTDSPVRVNPSRIGRVVMNLTTNARDSMPDGGRLEIHIGPSSTSERICLTVRDTGLGIDQITMKQIFKPYFTTKTAGRGTGLGLATVRDIVRDYGGEVVVDSSPKCGTAVRVHLPRAFVDSVNQTGNGTDIDSTSERRSHA